MNTETIISLLVDLDPSKPKDMKKFSTLLEKLVNLSQSRGSDSKLARDLIRDLGKEFKALLKSGCGCEDNESCDCDD